MSLNFRVPGGDNGFGKLGILDYMWYLPYLVVTGILYLPSYAIGKIMTQFADVASWVHVYLQGLQMFLGVGFLVYGALYLVTSSIYRLQYLSVMHIFFLCTMIPVSCLMVFTEYGVTLMRDPLHPDRRIHTWHPGMVVTVAEIGEMYGALFISCMMSAFLQILDLSYYGITRTFVTLQDDNSYRFVGMSLGFTMWIAAGTLYAKCTVRERKQPALRIAELPASMQKRRANS